MSILFMTLVVVGGLALVVELLNIFAKDFFLGGQAQEKIKESIRRTQSELRAADKKLGSMRTTRRSAILDLESAVSKAESLEKDLKRAPDVPPVLIHTVGGSGFGTRYRARISKTLPDDADENQALIWKYRAFVEVTAAAPAEAYDASRRQFPESHGYVIGSFTPVGAPAVESAA